MKIPRELVKNDLFTHRYSDVGVWRVQCVNLNGIVAHSRSWLKSSSIFLTFEELEKEKDFGYFGKMSKIRALFLL